MMRVHVGCSGWVYPHWRERFYPKGVPQRRWLELLRRALRHCRGQQHLLPARLPGRGRELAGAESGGVHLRREDEPLHDPHQAADHGGAGNQEVLRAARWPHRVPTSSVPFSGSSRRISTATASVWLLHCRSCHPAATPSSSGTRAGSPTRCTNCCREHGAALVIGDESSRWVSTPPVRTADWTYIRLHQGRRGRHGNYSASEIETWARRIAQWRRDTRGLRLLQQRLGGLRAPEREAAQEGTRDLEG